MTAPDGTRERDEDVGAAGPPERPYGAGTVELRSPGEVAAPAPPTLVSQDDDGDGGDDGSSGSARTGRRRRPLRTAAVVSIAVVVAAAAGFATTGVLGGDDGGPANAAPSGPPATAKVERTTLADTETVDGNLGYGDATAVQAPATPAGSSSPGGNGQTPQNADGAGDASAGIITWLPDEGDTIKRGQTVYRVDQRKIPLLYGSIPFYRTLKTGSEGYDVKILERNLSELGYSGFTVDDKYTYNTAQAVKDWQDDLDRDQTGTVVPGDALVASGARRVAEVQTSPGALLSGTVLTWTATQRIVTADLDSQFEDLVQKGTRATVKLPDDNIVPVKVTKIGTPTSDNSDNGGSGNSGSNSSDKATLPIEMKVTDQKKIGRYQAAAVEITLKAETRKNVLAVPITALVARQGGGYAVQVVEPTGVVSRPVKVGIFADSMVEVSGAGITEGTVVGVPQ